MMGQRLQIKGERFTTKPTKGTKVKDGFLAKTQRGLRNLKLRSGFH